MSNPLLTLDKLACNRGQVPVLEGVSLSLSAGDALVLRGPNGIGKTTLLRTIAGLQPPTAGGLMVDPDDIGYAGHQDGVKSTLTVSENLQFWASLFGQNDINIALQAYELLELRSRQASELSAGQRRRLGLARLLVTGRKLWLMDEPTVSLDAASVALFVASVEQHRASGGALLVATHLDLGLAGSQTMDLSSCRAVTRSTDEAFL